MTNSCRKEGTYFRLHQTHQIGLTPGGLCSSSANRRLPVSTLGAEFAGCKRNYHAAIKNHQNLSEEIELVSQNIACMLCSMPIVNESYGGVSPLI